MKRWVRLAVVAAIAVPALGAAAVAYANPEMGKAEGQCRAGENGPAFLVDVIGLKDHTGWLKVEVYPPTDPDFLADDGVLLAAGKTFRRVEQAVPADAVPRLCVRVPGPGRYAVVVLHDRDRNHRFNLQHDGIGFSNNPHLFLSQPRASAVATTAGGELTTLRIVLNYRTGLLSFGPIRGAQ